MDVGKFEAFVIFAIALVAAILTFTPHAPSNDLPVNNTPSINPTPFPQNATGYNPVYAGTDNATALYRQVFFVNYSKLDTIVDYQVNLSMNTSFAYNSSLQYCNFIAAWHPNMQAAPIWVPTYVAPDTCNNNWTNTTIDVKLPSLNNQNGSLALYFGFPMDGTLTYANNSGNSTFLLYDNGSTVAAASSLNVNLTDASQVFYPGRWNLSTALYSSTNNVSYAGGEIVLSHANSCSGGKLCRTKLSTNYNLTTDLRIEYKMRITGACSGDLMDGEVNTLVGWGGYSNIGIPTIDSPDSGVSASFGPGSGADPHLLNGAVPGLYLKINNWSTTGAHATNMWVNLTGKWPVANGLKLQTTGNPNYVSIVIASQLATEARSSLNKTTYTDITTTNYCIDGSSGCGNTSVWRFPYSGDKNGSFSSPTQGMVGRLLFDEREICSGGTQEYRFDDIRVSKYHPNVSVSIPVGMGLEGTSAAPPLVYSFGVNLTNPGNNSATNDSITAVLSYNYSGNLSKVLNCSVYLNNTVGRGLTYNATHATPIVGGINNISVTLGGPFGKQLLWNVNCSNETAAETPYAFSNVNQTIRTSNNTWAGGVSRGISNSNVTCNFTSQRNQLVQPFGQTSSLGYFNFTNKGSWVGNLSVFVLNSTNSSFQIFLNTTQNATLANLTRFGNATVLHDWAIGEASSSMAWLWVNCSSELRSFVPRLRFTPVAS